jgi:hypothetical protein
MGIQPALLLLTEGKRIKAAEAQKLGLIHAVVAAGTERDAARAWLLEQAARNAVPGKDGKPGKTLQPWDQKGFKIPGGGVMTPAGMQTFMAGNAMLREKTQGNYPAPKRRFPNRKTDMGTTHISSVEYIDRKKQTRAGAKPYCDIAKATCVECLDNTDCGSPNASSCVAGKCTACATNNDCSHIVNKGVCKPTLEPDAGVETGVCVECTGTDYDACSPGDAGTPQVCDSLKNVCTDYPERTAGLCQPCVSDAQCQAGELCVEQVFNGKSAGYFCLYQQGAPGAPADCTTARPYIKALSATSIDGTVASVCSLRVSTCTAQNQFSQTSCSSATNTADDTLCGFAHGTDSRCVPFGTSQHLCTVACGSDLDCRTGFTCNTSINPPVCNLL